METILATTFLLVIVSAHFRRMHQRYAELKFTNQLFKMRDELRMLAIRGEIDSSHWTFEYFDSTFSKAIKDAYSITLFHLIVLTRRHANDKNMKNVSKKLEIACQKNDHLERLHSEYLNAVKAYIIDQHKVSFFVLDPVFRFWEMNKRMSLAIKSAFVLPETSANGHLEWQKNNKPTFVSA